MKEKQFQTDKERLLNEIDWLNKQLNQKSTQLLESKTEYNKTIYEFESKVDNLQADVSIRSIIYISKSILKIIPLFRIENIRVYLKAHNLQMQVDKSRSTT